MTLRTAKMCQAVGFFVLANLFMLMGSDFPPPKGFIWISLTALLLALIQYVYSGHLLPKIDQSSMLLITLIFYASLGILVAYLFISFNAQVQGDNSGKGLWISIISLVFTGYGLVFWSLNKLIKPYIKDF